MAKKQKPLLGTFGQATASGPTSSVKRLGAGYNAIQDPEIQSYLNAFNDPDRFIKSAEEKKKKEDEERNRIAAENSPLAKAGRFAKNVGEGIAAPFKYLGEGFGEVAGEASGATARIAKLREQAQKANEAAILQARAKLQDPGVDENIKRRTRAFLKNLGETELPGQYQTENEQTQEIIGRTDPRRGVASVGSIGLDVVTGGVGGKALTGGKIVGKELAKNVGMGAVSGAGAGALSAAGEEELSLKSVFAGAGTGALIGGVLPAAAAGIKRGVQDTKRVIAGSIPDVEAANENIIRTQSLATTKATPKQRIAGIKDKAITNFLDRFKPVKDLVDEVQNITGKKVAAENDPYQLLKLRGGVEGQVYQYLQDNASWLKGVSKDFREDGDAYGYAKQFLSQSSKRTPEQLQKAKDTLDALTEKYGGDLSQLEEYAGAVRRSFDPLVDAMEEARMIAPEVAARLRSDPDYFAKMEVVQDVVESGFSRNSVNTRELALKGVKGQSNEARLAPSAEALVQQTTRVMNNIANNKVVRSFAELSDQVPENNGLVLKPQNKNAFSDKELPKDYTRLSYIDEGQRKEIAVPKELGDVLSGATVENFDKITRAVGTINNLFRQAVTTYNPLFVFVRNPARDFKSFLTNSRYVPVRRAVQDYTVGLFDSIFNTPAAKDFLRSGGGQAGYFSREGGQLGKQVAKTAKEITGKRSIVGRIVTSPRDFMQKASEAIEMAPRIAEFKAARNAGKSAEEAAVAGREVTVDFAQGGDFAKVANQWIPFLNARTQGTKRLARAFKENPKRALIVYAATSALPMAGLMYWNRSQHEDVWEQIPPYEKEGNFIFILGDGQDESGRFNQIVKIPKGDIDKIIGNTFETMLDQFYGQNPKGFAEAMGGSLLAGASNISPVSFERNGEFSPSQVLSGGLGTLKAPIQTITNYDFFKDAPIVPKSLQDLPGREQVKENTPWLAKTFGDLTGGSPLLAENFINSVAGQVPFQVTEPRRIAEQFAKGTAGAAGGQAANYFYDKLDEIRPEVKLKSKKITEASKAGDFNRARRLAEETNDYIDEQFKMFYNIYGEYLNTDEERQVYEDALEGLKASEDIRYLKRRAKD